MCCQGARSLVVVIESNMPLAHSLSLLLEDWGFDARVFPATDAAVEELGTDAARAVAIIFDQHAGSGVPAQDAARLTEQIGHAVPVIVMSNDLDDEPADGIPTIEKPFDPEQLQHWLTANV